MKKTIILFLITGILLPSFSFAQVIEAPNSIDEAKAMGKNVWSMVPNFGKELLQDTKQVLNWLFGGVFRIWNSYIYPILKKSVFPKVKERGPIIKEEFQKEKTEMKGEIKTEIPRVRKNIWQQIKDFMK